VARAHLGAVAEAVVVGVVTARVRAVAVLAEVREVVAVLVSLRLVLAEREVVALLPAVGDAVVVAVGGNRRCGWERPS
jgi:hypothetical protein